MKSLLVLLTTLVITLCFGCADVKSPPQQKFSLSNYMDQSTVALMAITGPNKSRTFCTASWIDKTFILTAGHCVQKENEDGEEESPLNSKIHYSVKGEVVEVDSQITGLHLAEVVAYDKAHDLALLHALGDVIPPHKIAKLASTLPELGTHVYIVGHPKGLYFTHIEGVISAYRTDEFPVSKRLGIKAAFIQVSSPGVYFGNSGGGLFNNNGEILGVCSLMTRAPNTSLFINVDEVRLFLQKYNETQDKK